MTKGMVARIAGALLALAVLVAVGRSVHADLETSVSAQLVAFHNVAEKVQKAVEGKLAKLPGVENKGRWGIDHCSPWDEWMKPAEHYGEEGPHCVFKNPASVTCKVIGYEKRVDDSGEVLWPILGDCNPKGGWAGSGAPRDDIQSP